MDGLEWLKQHERIKRAHKGGIVMGEEKCTMDDLSVTEARDSSPIDVRFDKLLEAEGALQLVVRELKERLEPVLLRQPNEPVTAADQVGTSPPLPVMCPLSEKIYTVDQRLRALRDVLSGITDQLEL